MTVDDRRTTLYLRNVPLALVRDAKVKAAREGTSLTAVVVRALARSLESGKETESSSEAGLRESVEWYQANRARLLRRYRNRYVAILDREIVDHDADFESLASRVFARWGTRPIFMPRVTQSAERARVRSPRRKAS